MNLSLHIEHMDEPVMRTLQQMAHEQHVSVEEVVRRYLRELSKNRKPVDFEFVDDLTLIKFAPEHRS
ncbi:MAG TPA: ribbon-helix-helix protein, CopG family [Candidatus Kapabacteria bacterium]|nr:ribbon-helix-helix protein, CopG family [Candidatus Kapabacteria bacterium]